MKTYNLFYVLLLALIFSCSKSEDTSTIVENETGTKAKYSVLLQNNGKLTSQSLNASIDSISLNSSQDSFGEKLMPTLSELNGTSFLQYYKTNDCQGTIAQTDFNSNSSTEIVVFEDLNECDLTATAITSTDDVIFISYILQNSEKPSYLVRLIDTKTANSFVDVALDKKPLDLVAVSNKLFVLTFDEEITDENSIAVIDLSTNAVIHEKGLGNDAMHIFKDGNDDVIISYDELHGILNSSTLEIIYKRYDESKAPNFVNAMSNMIDSSGKLYYAAESGEHSMYAEIPAVFDFTNNLTTLYAFENFLTDEKRSTEYELETTTAVSYDEGNDLILIGYKKSGSGNSGGILRIKPAPDAKFIDNIDLNGVPFEIIVN